ncbi:ABC transporter ATP-binding protein [Roseomonas sp. AR75]|uniref:ABC transporter ATP-binding protein n=1 Tax=Roseomonas sp. AR75 TaxID=2562311 RepID=UPI0014851EEF|nr:ABC transporter ATP-binding protein [Roseomonas sp. AR75]
MTAPDPILRLEGLAKSFQGQRVLHGLDIAIGRGEFVTLLGPSGCGKTTTLNLVAGLLAADEGSIRLRGAVVNDVPPQRRRLGMVFQSYALFPHMTVAENIAYGLEVQRMPSRDIAHRVGAMLDLVRLPGVERKFPSQLSGGMQQRVALARALVTEPDLLLLDEPLSNLDAALRREMQQEIKRIQTALGVATLLVTHSQEEALTMSDRIAVMRGGRIERLGTPLEVWRDPRTRFVCTFLGDATVLEAVSDGTAFVAGPLHLTPASSAPAADTRRTLAFRPEHVRLDPPADAPNAALGLVREASFRGAHVACLLDCEGLAIQAVLPADPGGRLPQPGTPHRFAIPPDAVMLLDD